MSAVKSRTGSIPMFAEVAVGAAIVTGMLYLGLNDASVINQAYREDTVGLMADRVAGDMMALDAYPEGKVEVDLGAEYSYSLLKNPPRVKIEYGDNSGTSSLPFDNAGVQTAEGESQILCLVKPGSGRWTIRSGGCE